MSDPREWIDLAQAINAANRQTALGVRDSFLVLTPGFTLPGFSFPT